jgi:hypothetical protein
MKLRIIKKETATTEGKVFMSRFLIQEKILWWWVDARIPCATVKSYGALIEYEGAIFYFSTLEDAKSALDKYFINPFKDVYKGNKIIRVMNSDFYKGEPYKDIYLNKSNGYTESTRYKSETTYEFAYSFEELKQTIDNRLKREAINNNTTIQYEYETQNP